MTKRYRDTASMVESADGAWVLFDDYAKMRSEIERELQTAQEMGITMSSQIGRYQIEIANYRAALEKIADYRSWHVCAAEREWVGSDHLIVDGYCRFILAGGKP